MLADSLLKKHAIISDQTNPVRLQVVLDQLEAVLHHKITGDVTEFGCHIGATSLFIQRMLDALAPEKQFYAYDSFEGLPAKHHHDNSVAGDQFKPGELYVSKKQFLAEFHKAGLHAPHTVKGWFKELTPGQLPEQIAFAFLDGDFYESILDSLRLVWPRLSPRAVICIDDYHREALPGVDIAVAEFFRDKPVKIHAEQGIGIVTS
jgi:O-methyltransferase